MAEAVFKHYVTEHHPHAFRKIDSAGTAGYHVGDPPDSRSVACCNKHGVPVSHVGQQLSEAHFDEFDWILVMDESNLSNAKRLAQARRNSTCRIEMFGNFDPKGEKLYLLNCRVISDPYYGGDDGFEHNYQQIYRCTKGFCKHLGLET